MAFLVIPAHVSLASQRGDRDYSWAAFLVCAALPGAAYAEPLGTISILSIDCGGKTNATLTVGNVVTISHSYNVGGEFLACIRNDSFACVSSSSTSVYTSGTPITRSFTLTGPFPNPAKLSVGDSVSAALQCPAAAPQTQTNTDDGPHPASHDRVPRASRQPADVERSGQHQPVAARRRQRGNVGQRGRGRDRLRQQGGGRHHRHGAWQSAACALGLCREPSGPKRR